MDVEPEKFEIVCSIAATDMLVYNYLMPVARHPKVSKLWIVRFEPAHKAIPNSEYALAPSRFLPIRWIRYLRHCIRLGRRKEVAAIINFNPLPYGLIALLAGWICRKPVHLGFIGSDWFEFGRVGWGRPFLPFMRRADFITVTGDLMRREMIEFGFEPDRMRILMHSIDLDAFQIGDPGQAEFDFIFVGRLIPLKRVDTIIDAFAEVLKTRPESRLCIVGGGPLEEELRGQVQRLGIGDSVTFTGPVTNVPDWLAKSRSLVMASEFEGFPFAMVEAMCSGLVPITTPAGTVADVIRDGENGFLFNVGDVGALARLMLRITDDPALYGRLRNEAVKFRDHVSYDEASRVWSEWFDTLRPAGD